MNSITSSRAADYSWLRNMNDVTYNEINERQRNIRHNIHICRPIDAYGDVIHPQLRPLGLGTRLARDAVTC